MFTLNGILHSNENEQVTALNTKMDELETLVREKYQLQWNMHYYLYDFIKVKIIISLIYVYKQLKD